MRTIVMRQASAAVGAIFVALLGLSLTAAVGADTATPEPAKPAALTVHIKDYKFTPETASVHVGDTVVFVNDDDETHTVTATDGSFDSKGLADKARFSYTFTKPGTYQYHCKIHTNMKGTIVVEPAGKGAQ